MLIVAERINASRKAIRAALEKLDAAAIQQEVRAQDAAGAALHRRQRRHLSRPRGRAAVLARGDGAGGDGLAAVPGLPDAAALAAALPG